MALSRSRAIKYEDQRVKIVRRQVQRAQESLGGRPLQWGDVQPSGAIMTQRPPGQRGAHAALAVIQQNWLDRRHAAQSRPYPQLPQDSSFLNRSK